MILVYNVQNKGCQVSCTQKKKKTPNPSSTKTGLNWMKSFEEQNSNKGAQQSFKPVELEKEEETGTSNSRV